MGHPDMDKKEEGSDNQKESGQNNADSTDGFVLVHAKAVGQRGKDERPCAQTGEIEIHSNVEAECFLVKDVVQNLSIHFILFFFRLFYLD